MWIKSGVVAHPPRRESLELDNLCGKESILPNEGMVLQARWLFGKVNKILEDSDNETKHLIKEISGGCALLYMRETTKHIKKVKNTGWQRGWCVGMVKKREWNPKQR